MSTINDSKKLLEITIPTTSQKHVRENIKKYIDSGDGFCHIVSLNAENMVTAINNKEFKNVVERAQITIIDGAGVVAGAWICGCQIGDRYPGVDLMVDLLKMANEKRLRVMLIGGGAKVAYRVVECQKEKFPNIEFSSLEGITDISKPTDKEESELFSIVAAQRPHLVFVAFGSPAQELFIYKNRHKFGNTVVMGVGGAFDFLSGRIPRAPKFVRKLGFEWLFRLIRQPWRLKRQLKIPYFYYLILREKFS